MAGRQEIENQPRQKIFNLILVLTCNIYTEYGNVYQDPCLYQKNSGDNTSFAGFSITFDPRHPAHWIIFSTSNSVLE